MGKSASVAGEHRVVAAWQHTDKSVRVDKLRRGDTFLVRCVKPAVAQVLHNRSGKEVHILKNNAHGAAQVVLADIVYVDSVVGYRAAVYVIEMVDKICNGGFARSGCADEGDLLTGLGVERHVVEHLFALFVREIHVLKVNLAAEPAVLKGAVLLRNFPCPFLGELARFLKAAALFGAVHKGDFAGILLGGLVDKLENSLSAGNRHNDGVYLLRNLSDRLAEAAGKLQKRSNYAEGEHVHPGKTHVGNAFYGKSAAHYCDDYIKHIAKTVHKGHKGVGVFVRVGNVGAKLAVAAVKGFLCLFFVVKDLYNLLTVYHFLDIAVHSGDGALRAHKVAAGFACDSAHKLHHKEAEHKHNGGKQKALIQHGNRNEHNGQNGLNDLRQALRKHHTKCVRVVCVIAHYIAVAVGVKVFDRKCLHMLKHIVTHIFEHALSYLRHNSVIEQRRKYADKIEARHSAKRPNKRRKVRRCLTDKRFNVVVNKGFKEQRRRNACQGAEHYAYDYKNHLCAVPAEVAEQSFHRCHINILDGCALCAGGGALAGFFVYGFFVSHRTYLLSGIHKPRGKYRLFSTAHHESPLRRFCRRQGR